MPALEDIIKRRTEAEGPMDVALFMELAVAHYYATRDPFGVNGDFITAPEISQMFGELTGAWAADQWFRLGRPGRFTLLECGPGRGTLMADALRATKHVPGFHDAAAIVLLENSPALKEKQKAALAGHKVRWIETLDDLSGPVILIANEFLDALPIQQFVFTGGEWQERVVISEGNHLSLSSRRRPGSMGVFSQWTPAFAGVTEGKVYETSQVRENFVRNVCKILKVNKGVALFIDYGYEGPAAGDTLQAVKNHRFVPVLENPGEADLTAHVDFGALRRIAQEEGLPVSLTTQGEFLRSLGIEARAQALGAKASEKQKMDIASALERLTGANEMGRLFRVMVVPYY